MLMRSRWRHKIYITRTKRVTRRVGWKDRTVRRLEKTVAAGEAVQLCTNWFASSAFVWVRVTELYWERMENMTQDDCCEEGRPDLTPMEWCEWYAEGDKNCDILVIKYTICCPILGCDCAACR